MHAVDRHVSAGISPQAVPVVVEVHVVARPAAPGRSTCPNRAPWGSCRRAWRENCSAPSDRRRGRNGSLPASRRRCTSLRCRRRRRCGSRGRSGRSASCAGDLDQLAAFPGVLAQRRLDVNVLAGLARPNAGEAMPVVGRGDDHGVDRLVVQGAAKVLHALRRAALLHLGQGAASRGEQLAVDVAKVGHAAIGPLRRGAPARVLPRPRDADHRQDDSLVGRGRPNRSGVGQQGDSRRRSQTGLRQRPINSRRSMNFFSSWAPSSLRSAGVCRQERVDGGGGCGRRPHGRVIACAAWPATIQRRREE